jgi:hypothetical protein
MRPVWELLILNVVSFLMALGALGVAVWVLVSGQIQSQGIDGLFLFLVCLLIAVAFSLSPIRQIRRGAWRELLNRREVKTAEPEAPPADVRAPSETREKETAQSTPT